MGLSLINMITTVNTISAVLLLGSVTSSNVTLSEPESTCEASAFGPWSQALEDWATSARVQSDRHGRVMALPSTKGYYVTDRFDSNYLTPPPPHSHINAQGHVPQSQSHPHPAPVYISQPGHVSPQGNIPLHGIQASSSHAMHIPQGYKEWEGAPPPPGGGKIVNRPPKPYKDKFKPSYPAPVQPEQRPPSGSIDRIDEPPRKQVTETDLYLLSAIEKLVYRVDLMEKRLRKMEDGVRSLLAGGSKPGNSNVAVPALEPCPGNYSRVGGACYEWSDAALDWKGASLACRKRGAALLELADAAQRDRLYSRLLNDQKLRGSDFWTGGLNPGLLWIWSQSARPVQGNGTGVGDIAGEGRCLALVGGGAHYSLRGQDCALALRYVCQTNEEDRRANDI